MDNTAEDISLAVEIIRQLENLDYPNESILQAMIYVCEDTLQKLPEVRREYWREKLELSFQSQKGQSKKGQSKKNSNKKTLN